MTAPTEEAPTPAEASSPAPGAFLDFLDLDPPAPSTRSGRGGWWRIGFPVTLVLLFLAIPVLVYTGVRVVLQSNHGRLIVSATDPAQPGWEAAVEPTPTSVMATVTDAGQLSSVALLALTGPQNGNVIFVPADTQVPDQPGYKTMVDAYATGGPVGLKAALEAVLHVDVGEVQVADGAKWGELVAPIGTITVANPDDVDVGGQRFPRGSIDLTPAQVATYLRSRNYGEDDTNRLLRHEAFWRAWLALVQAKGPDSVPGESESGTGRFVRALATDQVEFHVLPVRVQARPDAYAGVYVPITADSQALVAQAVPFPTAAPPGSRPRLRVLDGTGQLDHGVDAAMTLAAAGAQIDGIGNASTFSVPTTQFIISNEDQRAAAQKYRDALGVGDVVLSENTNDSVDMTVILGADAVGLDTTRTGGSSSAGGVTVGTGDGGTGG